MTAAGTGDEAASPAVWVAVEDVVHGYGDHRVLQGLSFRLEQGTIGCLLGPSGCGKTTALRCIAGLEPVERGRILTDGAVLSAPGDTVVPERRGMGMVFQDYALFPHLSVSANVAFGLSGLDRAERRSRAERLLGVVGLGDSADVYPHELSGGQQQRVALARALAPEPRLLLLDEPFSNLDAAMRADLGAELREILKRLGITALMVTHDQQEAFAIADQIGVMNEGRLLQWGSPASLYRQPADPFVARFIGEGCLLPGTRGDDGLFTTELGRIAGRLGGPGAGEAAGVEAVDILLRASDLRWGGPGDCEGHIQARAFRGADVLYRVALPSGRVVKLLAGGYEEREIGERVSVAVDAGELVAFPHARASEAPRD